MPGQPATAPFSRQARAAANGHLTMATHVAGIAEKSLREEGIPALFEVGEEHHVIDVTQSVRVVPPDRPDAQTPYPCADSCTAIRALLQPSGDLLTRELLTVVISRADLVMRTSEHAHSASVAGRLMCALACLPVRASLHAGLGPETERDP